MAIVTEKDNYPVSADVLWGRVGDPADMSWHPMITEVTVNNETRKRTIKWQSGMVWVDHIDTHVPKERYYLTSLVDAPLILRSCVSTVRVTEGGKNQSALELSVEFVSVGQLKTQAHRDANEVESVKLFKALYQVALNNIHNTLPKKK